MADVGGADQAHAAGVFPASDRTSLVATSVDPRAWVRQHPLLSYCVLAFACSWAIMVPLTLASWGLLAFPASLPVFVLMGYGPTFAALIVTGALGGRAAIRSLLGRLLIWRVGWRWYAAALLLNAGIVLGADGLFVLTGGVLPAWPQLGPGLVLDVVVTFVLVTVVNGEEIGWRGFAWPRMAARWGLPAAVLALGTIEAVFHLPIFFNNGASEAGGQNGTPVVAFVASSVLATLLLGWVFNTTRGSLLMAYLFHGSMNAWSNVLPFPSTSATFFWCLAAVQFGVCAIVVVVWRWRLRVAPGAEACHRLQ
jgi:uncharacterized protein